MIVFACPISIGAFYSLGGSNRQRPGHLRTHARNLRIFNTADLREHPWTEGVNKFLDIIWSKAIRCSKVISKNLKSIPSVRGRLL